MACSRDRVLESLLLLGTLLKQHFDDGEKRLLRPIGFHVFRFTLLFLHTRLAVLWFVPSVRYPGFPFRGGDRLTILKNPGGIDEPSQYFSFLPLFAGCGPFKPLLELLECSLLHPIPFL